MRTRAVKYPAICYTACTMVKYKWFGVENPDLNLDLAIVMPNHLGASLDKDFGHKAKRVAEHTGRAVLAYERPFTGSQATFTLAARRTLQPRHYLSTASQTGRELDKILSHSGYRKFILSGNSAGALDVAAITGVQTLRPDFLALGDIVGLRKAGFIEGLRAWAEHQRLENSLPAELRNSDPGPAVPVSEMTIRAVKEIGLYSASWRNPLGMSTLVHLATNEDFENIAVNVEFPGHTFTESPAVLRDFTSCLNSQRPPTASRPFAASFTPERYHSYYNDPRNFADFIGRTLALASQTD